MLMKKIINFSILSLIGVTSAYASVPCMSGGCEPLPYDGKNFPSVPERSYATMALRIENASGSKYYVTTENTETASVVDYKNTIAYGLNQVIYPDSNNNIIDAGFRFLGSFTEAYSGKPMEVKFTPNDQVFLSFYDPVKHKACAFSVYSKSGTPDKLFTSNDSNLTATIKMVQKPRTFVPQEYTAVVLTFKGC